MERSVIVAEGESERPSSSPFEVSPKGRVVVTPPFGHSRPYCCCCVGCLSNAFPTASATWRSHPSSLLAVADGGGRRATGGGSGIDFCGDSGIAFWKPAKL